MANKRKKKQTNKTDKIKSHSNYVVGQIPKTVFVINAIKYEDEGGGIKAQNRIQQKQNS